MPDEREPAAAEQLSRSLGLLWRTRKRPNRGPKPGLTLDRIVDAAIAVADAGGVDAVSMRRVAGELGAGTMSLYRHVPGKPELLALMLDRICEPDDRLERAAGMGWRAALEVFAHCSRDLYLAHPWLLQVNWSRPILGPNSLAGVEAFISTLDGLGLTDQERVAVMTTIDGFVTGVVRSQILYGRAAEETGLSDEQFWGAQSAVLEQAMATGNYPAMASLSTDAFGLGWDDSFRWGLGRLLDGIAALVESRNERVRAATGGRGSGGSPSR